MMIVYLYRTALLKAYSISALEQIFFLLYLT